MKRIRTLLIALAVPGGMLFAADPITGKIKDKVDALATGLISVTASIAVIAFIVGGWKLYKGRGDGWYYLVTAGVGTLIALNAEAIVSFLQG